MPENAGSLSKSKFTIVLLCFFLSGGAGLIYQIAWTKALGLIFGHTVYAIATVLAAFMGGLAAGSVYLGPWGQRHGRPVTLYGWLEILTGAAGALSFVGLIGVRYLYLATYHIAGGSTAALVALRLVASAIVLFLPTFLMGGTLPILAGGLSNTSTELGSRLGRLYWVNTAGAVVGALAAGFAFLPGIGFRRTLLWAVLLNFLAGILALYTAGEKSGSVSVEKIKTAKDTIKIPRYLLITFAIVGATAMVYEVAWSRLLATTLGSSTYAFTVMLATFLTGITVGSRLFEAWLRRGHRISVTTFSVTQVLTGLGAVLFLLLFRQLPTILWTLITATHKTFDGLVVAQFAICALAMLPTAIVFGFNFPVVTMLIAGREQSDGPSSAAVGRACAANTIGAILGSIAAGFWLVPSLGSFRLVVWTATANLALAVFLLAREAPRQNFKMAEVSALGALVLFGGYSKMLYDPAVANFGVITTRGLYPDTLSLDEVVRTKDLLFAEDGLNASISVTQGEDNLALATNGKVDASTGDTTTQMMLGHLGMIFHQAPRKVLVIGFGSGMTVSAVSRYPGVQQIDCVEIEPAVLHAASYLKPLNRGVLSDPRVRVIVDDARNFLFTTQTRYDLIISEPSNPWIAGVADLFTNEFYQQARARLAPGGTLVQWVQLYSVFPQDLKMVLKTVAGNFPQVTVWKTVNGDILLLGQSEPAKLSFDRMHRLWSQPQLRADYQDMGLQNPEGMLGYFLLDDADLRTLVAGAPLNTDDLTRLEYRAPLAIFAGNALAENIQMLSQQRSRLLPASIEITNPRESLMAAAGVLAWMWKPTPEAVYIKALANYPPSADSEVLRAKWLATASRIDEARTAFVHALLLDPSSTDARIGLAEIARLQNDPATAKPLLQSILARDPKYIPALSSFALLEESEGHLTEALQWQEKRMAADTDPPISARMDLAELLLRTGDVRDAASQYIEVLNRDAYNSNAHYVLGEIFRQQRDWEQARIQLETAIRYAPTGNPQAYLSLADVYRNLGEDGEATEMLERSARVFPTSAFVAHAANE